MYFEAQAILLIQREEYEVISGLWFYYIHTEDGKTIYLPLLYLLNTNILIREQNILNNIHKMAEKQAQKVNEKVQEHYHNIPFTTRRRLIEMVFEEEMSIYLAAKLLQLPYSTAKAISKRYETQGVIFKPKQRNSKKRNPSKKNIKLTSQQSEKPKIKAQQPDAHPIEVVHKVEAVDEKGSQENSDLIVSEPTRQPHQLIFPQIEHCLPTLYYPSYNGYFYPFFY